MPIQAQEVSRRDVLKGFGRAAMAAPALGVIGCNDVVDPARRLVLTGHTMGTTYRVTLEQEKHARSATDLRSDIESILGAVINQMSTYEPSSDLSRFNISRSSGRTPVSREVVNVVSRALEISNATDGAFDPTIGPLVNLWGFGPEQAAFEPDNLLSVHSGLKNVGYRKLAIDKTTSTLRKDHPNLYVDLSGIAKGHAVDRIAGYLKQADVSAFLVDIGGEMRAHRNDPRRRPWRIGVEKPLHGPRRIHRVIAIGEGSVATSGDYRNFTTRGTTRYSHIIDPRSGAPARHDLASVTVVAPTAEDADAWSTALMVLGPREGFAFAEREGIAAHFMERSGGNLIESPTRTFQRFLVG